MKKNKKKEIISANKFPVSIASDSNRILNRALEITFLQMN